jgi:hypothetical protein
MSERPKPSVQPEKYVIDNRETPILSDSQIQETLTYLNLIKKSELYTNGYITLALIKPHAEMNCCGYSDKQAYQEIKNRIETFIVFEFSSMVPKKFWETWYDGTPKSIMSSIPATNQYIYPNKWEEYLDNLSTGSNTFLLLQFDKPNAINTWRTMIGPTDPIKAKRFAPESIRAQLARDFENNLVHGSDSPEALYREFELMYHFLENLRHT